MSTLTEAEIDKLEGRALDQAIAETVFERNRLLARFVDDMSEPQYHWGYPIGHDVAPTYSTDLVLAFQVAQHMAERIFRGVRGDPGHLDDDELNSLTLAQCSSLETDGAWMAAFQVFNPWPEDFEPEHVAGLRAVALARTAPLAICRAALKAVLL